MKYEKSSCSSFLFFVFSEANEIMKWPLTELGKTMGGTVLGKDMFIENENTSGWIINMYSPLFIHLFFFIPQTGS